MAFSFRGLVQGLNQDVAGYQQGAAQGNELRRKRQLEDEQRAAEKAQQDLQMQVLQRSLATPRPIDPHSQEAYRNQYEAEYGARETMLRHLKAMGIRPSGAPTFTPSRTPKTGVDKPISGAALTRYRQLERETVSGMGNHPARTPALTERVLRQMLSEGSITRLQYDAAQKNRDWLDAPAGGGSVTPPAAVAPAGAPEDDDARADAAIDEFQRLNGRLPSDEELVAKLREP